MMSYKIALPIRHLLPFFVVLVVAIFALCFSWPGIATHDTIFTTQEAITGRYTTYHPLLNALLLRLFAIPLGSYWLYTTLQISLCAAYFFRAAMIVSSYSERRWVALAMTVMWALAPATVLYLGIIWKDVLVAYALIFTAALIFSVRSDRPTVISKKDVWLFGTALFLIFTLRHGMVMNVLIIPFFLGFSRIRSAGLRLPLVLAFIGWLGMTALSAAIAHNDSSHMKELELATLSQPFLGIVAHTNGYTSDDLVFDAKLASYAFGDQYAKEYTPDYFRNRVVLTDPADLNKALRAIVMRTPRLCLMNLSQCVSGRIEMMLATLQPSTKFGGMTFYDLGSMPDCLKTFGMNPEKCTVLEKFEKSGKLSWAKPVMDWTTENLVEPRTLLTNIFVWNLVPQFLLVIFVLVVFDRRSPLWVISGFFVAQLALPLATVTANDFRYYYFLSLYGAVFFPLIVALAFDRGGRHIEAIRIHRSVRNRD
jgi:hypothetical protein